MADFSAVRQDECRDAKIPDGCTLGSSRTVVLQSVLNEIKEHGRSSMHAEVCGVLVGSLCWDGGPYLLIDGRIEGRHASHQSGSVTFTSETWDFIHEELATKYTERIIVGWYHTHPGFGIFLSNMDAFIHENFFSFSWEPAYVFDPQAETDGFFFKVGTELTKEEVSVFADVAPSIKEPYIVLAPQDRIVVNDSQRRRYATLAIITIALLCGAAAIVLLSLDKIRDAKKIANLERTVREREAQIFDQNTEIGRLKAELAAARKPEEEHQSEVHNNKGPLQQGEKTCESSPCSVLSPRATKPETTDKKERRWYASWVIVIRKQWRMLFQSNPPTKLKGEK